MNKQNLSIIAILLAFTLAVVMITTVEGHHLASAQFCIRNALAANANMHGNAYRGDDCSQGNQGATRSQSK